MTQNIYGQVGKAKGAASCLYEKRKVAEGMVRIRIFYF